MKRDNASTPQGHCPPPSLLLSSHNPGPIGEGDIREESHQIPGLWPAFQILFFSVTLLVLSKGRAGLYGRVLTNKASWASWASALGDVFR